MGEDLEKALDLFVSMWGMCFILIMLIIISQAGLFGGELSEITIKFNYFGEFWLEFFMIISIFVITIIYIVRKIKEIIKITRKD